MLIFVCICIGISLWLDINDWAMKNNIGVERARVRMSQQELAEKTGVIRQTIAAIEQRRFNPSTVLALKIANIFNLSVEQLFELEDTDWDR